MASYKETVINTETPALDHLVGLLEGYRASMVLDAATGIQIFDKIHDLSSKGKTTADSLATAQAWDRGATARMLDALASLKLLTKTTTRGKYVFKLTESGSLLRKNSWPSLHGYCKQCQTFGPALAELGNVIKHGEAGQSEGCFGGGSDKYSPSDDHFGLKCRYADDTEDDKVKNKKAIAKVDDGHCGQKCQYADDTMKGSEELVKEGKSKTDDDHLGQKCQKKSDTKVEAKKRVLEEQSSAVEDHPGKKGRYDGEKMPAGKGHEITESDHGHDHHGSHADTGESGDGGESWAEFYETELAFARSHTAPLLHMLDLSNYKSAVDVAGGCGVFSFALASIYPKMEVTLYESADAMPTIRKDFLPGNENLNVKLHEGEFATDDLPQSDLFLLSQVILNLSDEQLDQLMKKIHASTNKGGAILIIEKCLDDNKAGPPAAHMWDLLLMSHGGRLRSRPEYSAMLTKYGYKNIQMIQTQEDCFYDAIFAEKI